VLSNRKGGPERVLDVVRARAANGFERLEDVINPAERPRSAANMPRLPDSR
jgi:hypothetical protein